jgi:hypothetical protein
MARQRIAMSSEDATAFLATKPVAVIGTLTADGAPDGEAATLVCQGGEVEFEVARDGPTHRNLLADPRAVVSVEEFPSYAEIRGVTVHGRALRVSETSDRIRFRLADVRLESFDFRKMRRG